MQEEIKKFCPGRVWQYNLHIHPNSRCAKKVLARLFPTENPNISRFNELIAKTHLRTHLKQQRNLTCLSVVNWIYIHTMLNVQIENELRFLSSPIINMACFYSTEGHHSKYRVFPSVVKRTKFKIKSVNRYSNLYIYTAMWAPAFEEVCNATNCLFCVQNANYRP